MLAFSWRRAGLGQLSGSAVQLFLPFLKLRAGVFQFLPRLFLLPVQFALRFVHFLVGFFPDLFVPDWNPFFGKRFQFCGYIFDSRFIFIRKRVAVIGYG